MMAYGDISHLEGVFVEDVCERAIEVTSYGYSGRNSEIA